MKFKEILLPFDGSKHSVNAANYALNLAKLYEAHVTIVNCYEWSSNLPEVPETLIEELKLKRMKDAEAVLEKATNIFADQDVEYNLETIAGRPGDVLVNLSKSKQYDLIIMGSHGHSDIAGLFLGSVTHKVLNTIYCPVMIVP